MSDGMYFLTPEAAASANAFIRFAMCDSCLMKVMRRGQVFVAATRRCERGPARGVIRAVWRGSRDKLESD